MYSVVPVENAFPGLRLVAFTAPIGNSPWNLPCAAIVRKVYGSLSIPKFRERCVSGYSPIPLSIFLSLGDLTDALVW